MGVPTQKSDAPIIKKQNGIASLIHAANGKEQYWFEFKATLEPNKLESGESLDDYRWNVAKAVIAMANTSGGIVLVGVGDNAEAIGINVGAGCKRESFDEYAREVLNPAVFPEKNLWRTIRNKDKERTLHQDWVADACELNKLRASHVEFQEVYYHDKMIAGIIVSPVEKVVMVKNLTFRRDILFIRQMGDMGLNLEIWDGEVIEKWKKDKKKRNKDIIFLCNKIRRTHAFTGFMGQSFSLLRKPSRILFLFIVVLVIIVGLIFCKRIYQSELTSRHHRISMLSDIRKIMQAQKHGEAWQMVTQAQEIDSDNMELLALRSELKAIKEKELSAASKCFEKISRIGSQRCLQSRWVITAFEDYEKAPLPDNATRIQLAREQYKNCLEQWNMDWPLNKAELEQFYGKIIVELFTASDVSGKIEQYSLSGVFIVLNKRLKAIYDAYQMNQSIDNAKLIDAQKALNLASQKSTIMYDMMRDKLKRGDIGSFSQ